MRSVLAWIHLLVLEVLDKPVITSCNGGAKKRANPVDPVVAHELRRGNGRTEASCWV